MRRAALALVLLAPLAGCLRLQDRSVLRDLPPDAPTAEYAVRVPEGYDVRSVGFGAAYATSVSGGNLGLPVTGSSSQQPYVHVHAVERATGQDVLLVYADIRRRAEPVAIIRLERGDALRVAR